MPIDLLNAFVALILAISLASERLVSLVKNFWTWLATKHQSAQGNGIPHEEKLRRGIVIVLALAAAWVTTGFLTESPNLWDPFGQVQIGSEKTLPAWLVAFLASGGSSLWSNILGYTKALKDLRKEQLNNNAAPN